MKASELMTKDVLSVDKDERLETVLTTMQKRHVSKLVVTEKGKLAGVVTDADIADELGAIKNRGVPAAHLHASSAMRRHHPTIDADTPLERILEELIQNDAGLLPVVHDDDVVGVVTGSDLMRLVDSGKTLGDIATTQLHAVSPTDRVIHARRIMVDHQVDRLPVLDGGGIVGILGNLDMATGWAKFKAQIATARQKNALDRFRVQDVMQANVITAPPTMTVQDGIKTMREHDIGCLPITQADRITGIVTRTDLLQLL